MHAIQRFVFRRVGRQRGHAARRGIARVDVAVNVAQLIGDRLHDTKLFVGRAGIRVFARRIAGRARGHATRATDTSTGHAARSTDAAHAARATTGYAADAGRAARATRASDGRHRARSRHTSAPSWRRGGAGLHRQHAARHAARRERSALFARVSRACADDRKHAHNEPTSAAEITSGHDGSTFLAASERQKYAYAPRCEELCLVREG